MFRVLLGGRVGLVKGWGLFEWGLFEWNGMHTTQP